MLKKLFGGRPMKFTGRAFTDHVSGKAVNYYTDTLGRRWMAESRWAIFRVPVEACHNITHASKEGGKS